MPRAARVAEEILHDYHPQVESVTLVPSSGGVFEVSVDGELIYSKKQTGRHAEEGEVRRLFGERLQAAKS